MSGHDQAQLGLVKDVLKLLRSGAALRERGDRGPNRSAAGSRGAISRGGLGGVVLIVSPQAPDPLIVLGQVDELKPARERTDEYLSRIEVEFGHPPGQLVGCPLVAAARTLAKGHGQIEQLHRLGALGQGDHLAQDLAQKLLISRETALSRRVAGWIRDGRHVPSLPHACAEW
jgi:hypothetical protein